MPALLAEVTRGNIVESRHHGHVAVCDGKGNLIAKAGDLETVTYIRSACKPIQALNVFMSGAQDKYNFSSKELAIMCASHCDIYGDSSCDNVAPGAGVWIIM